MVAENAAMPSAASRSERIIFSFVQLLARRFLPKNRIRFSPGEQLSFGQYLPHKIPLHLAGHSSDVRGSKTGRTRIGKCLPLFTLANLAASRIFFKQLANRHDAHAAKIISFLQNYECCIIV
jgi:hypothetical protein